MSSTTAMIIGASSKLSQQLAMQLSEQGVQLALLVQDPLSIESFAKSLQTNTTVYQLDIINPEKLIKQLTQVWQQYQSVELIIVNTGLNLYDPQLPWQADQAMITVNVQGFAAICNTAFKLFQQQGYGQLAAINSIAGLRGGANVTYHASKSFAQNYLEGLAMHAQKLKLPITISDIQLGLLDKSALQGNKLWLSPLPKVARQIIKALAKGKRTAYVTKRWMIIALLTKLLPEFIYNTRRWKSADNKIKSS